jgi:kynureninase
VSDIFKKPNLSSTCPTAFFILMAIPSGPLPKAAAARVEAVMKAEWGQMLITGWNKAGWMAQPNAVGDRLARLIGAQSGHVVVGDTLSIKVYQALDAALQLRPDRKVILSDSGNFPSDLYIAQGLIQALNQGHELRLVAPEDLHNHITEEVAVTLITQVDYRTGRLHDMCSITETAHQNGALCIWDLAHSCRRHRSRACQSQSRFCRRLYL